MGHSDWPLTGHSDLSMTKQPHPFGLPHSKCDIYLVRQTKFKAKWVMYGNNYATHILHATLGIAIALLYQEGQVTITVLLLSLTV